MSTNTQKQGSLMRSKTTDPSSSLAEMRTQLKSIGDQVESIAKKFESRKTGIDCQGLYEIGSKIEHFLDNLESEKLIGIIKEPTLKASVSKSIKSKKH